MTSLIEMLFAPRKSKQQQAHDNIVIKETREMFKPPIITTVSELILIDKTFPNLTLKEKGNLYDLSDYKGTWLRAKRMQRHLKQAVEAIKDGRIETAEKLIRVCLTVQIY